MNGKTPNNERNLKGRVPATLESTQEKLVQFQALREHHREIMRMLALGLEPSVIAQRLGVTTQTVSNVRNSQLGIQYAQFLQDVLDQEVQAVARRNREVALEAQLVLEDIMFNEKAPFSVRARIAADTLDRAGFQAPKKVEVTAEHMHLTYEDIQKIKENAAKAKAQREVVPFTEDITGDS